MEDKRPKKKKIFIPVNGEEEEIEVNFNDQDDEDEYNNKRQNESLFPFPVEVKRTSKKGPLPYAKSFVIKEMKRLVPKAPDSISASTVINMLTSKGVSRSTIRKVKKELGIVSRKVGEFWEWQFPGRNKI